MKELKKSKNAWLLAAVIVSVLFVAGIPGIILSAVNGMTFAAGEKLTKSFMMTKDLLAKAEKAAVAKFNATEKDVENVVGKLIALNPAKLLKAGYMRAEKAGSPITSAADIAVGDKIKLHAAFGSLDVTVDNIDITEVE